MGSTLTALAIAHTYAATHAATHTVSFRPERGHVYDVHNNGTLLTVTDDTTDYTVLHEWIPIGCIPSPYAMRTLGGDVLLEFQCGETVWV